MRHGGVGRLLIAFCLCCLRGRKVYSLFSESEVKSLECLIENIADSGDFHLSRVLLLSLELTACKKQSLDQIVHLCCVIFLLEMFGSTEELLLWAEQYKIRCHSFSFHLIGFPMNCCTSIQDRLFHLDTSMEANDPLSSDITFNRGSKADGIIFGLNEVPNYQRSVLDKQTLSIRPSFQLEFQVLANNTSCWMRKYYGKTMKAVIFPSIHQCNNTSNFIILLIKIKVKVIFVQKTISDDIKEHLLNEKIYWFERLGKIQTSELRKNMSESFFHTVDEFLFVSKNSLSPPALVQIKLKRDAFGVFVLVRRRCMQNRLASTLENNGCILEGNGIECRDVFSFPPFSSLRAIGPGKSSFVHIDTFFDTLKLLVGNLLLESSCSLKTTYSGKGTTRQSILKLLWSTRLFESLNYSIRLLQTS
ncbi:unnamed protein product [Phytomonas sp. EM1]|nr:unnamed protein product [Phytomonas sp. EM1]|eukprot:CCW63609.1 unnamed protein product [Phytomonas sp. isolate EM1]